MGENVDRLLASLYSQGQPATIIFLADVTTPAPPLFLATQEGRCMRFGVANLLKSEGIVNFTKETVGTNLMTHYKNTPEMIELYRDLYLPLAQVKYFNGTVHRYLYRAHFYM
jgi:hypothetical protein